MRTADRRLIINADDFGLTPGVTSGILEAHAAGAVTSTSMMVKCPGWADGVTRARATPSLGIGLHFNLLVGAPLTRSASICGSDGKFLSLAALTRRSLLGAVRATEVTLECEAQLGALVDAGIQVTHIDSHRHTHALPVVRRAVAVVAASHRLPLRRPVEARWSIRDDLSRRSRSGLVAWSWRVASIGAPATRAPDYFVGMSLHGDRQFASRLAQLLDAIPAGTTELIVHPGHVDDVLGSVDGYTAPRERELIALCDPELRVQLRRDHVELIGFRAL